MSGSSKETDEQLKRNINDQLDRLVKQLADLEEYRLELDDDEYAEMKKDTIEQLQEFSQTLTKITSGNMTLVDDFSAMRMAVQAAISEAFKTPEIIALFARKQPATLRLRLEELNRDYKIRKVGEQIYFDRKLEILTALKKLNDHLNTEEEEFLTKHSTANMADFQLVASDAASGDKMLNFVNKSLAK
uniref:Beta-catenin-interacting ICAT domain-containing protein n=1 Tax=Plectus sambesii TaxID=2011161 RepID=A0A914UQW8_9BILA